MKFAYSDFSLLVLSMERGLLAFIQVDYPNYAFCDLLLMIHYNLAELIGMDRVDYVNGRLVGVLEADASPRNTKQEVTMELCKDRLKECAEGHEGLEGPTFS